MKKVKHKRKSRKGLLIGILCLLLATVCGIAGCLYWYLSQNGMMKTAKTEKAAEEKKTETEAETKPSESKTASFHFTGVGDNLLHDPIFVYYEEDNQSRDYLPIYEATLPYTQNADLSYINFETLCAGDEFGLSGYPNFNGPKEMMDTLKNAGFNWFSICSNHSFDRGADGLMAEMNYIQDNMPDVAYTGSNLSQEASSTPKVVDVNGVKVGLESFTYGLNGYVLPEGQEWLVNQFTTADGGINYDLIKQKLDALKAVSDVQIVTMHWGEEYQNTPNELQQEAARYLNEQGVEVIIGTHPHVIQPAEFISGPEQETLVYYSLGNFLSSQDEFARMIGGMADFDLNYDFNTKKTTFSNVKFIPTITYISPDIRRYKTSTIHEYNNDWAADHYLQVAYGQDMSKEAVQNYVREVMQDPVNIEVVYE
ncbi:MAG: CapA family protein [Ileibacterium sp.]|nr:CapA family protein [Ileibacterium sp.]